MGRLVAYAYTADVASRTDSDGNTVWPIALRTVTDPDNQGRIHKFLQFRNGSGDVALVDGGVVGYDTSFDWVTNDVSDTSIYRVVGIARAVLTDLNAGWIQIQGANLSAMETDGNVVEGSLLIWEAGDDNEVELYTAGTNDSAVFAIAIAADGTQTQPLLAVGNGILLGRHGA